MQFALFLEVGTDSLRTKREVGRVLLREGDDLFNGINKLNLGDTKSISIGGTRVGEWRIVNPDPDSEAGR